MTNQMFKRGLIKIVNNQKKEGLSKKKLDNLLKKWQKRLSLNDWNISLKIVNFKRKDYRQSGDFVADQKNKKAIIFMAADPFLKDQNTIEKEEIKTLVHELTHVRLWNLDNFIEETVLKSRKNFDKEYQIYLGKLEKTVDDLTQILLSARS